MPEDELLVGQELVDVEDAPVQFGGAPLTMHIGRPRWHAVRGGELAAICGTAKRRLLPMGLEWSSAFPEHIERCSACLAALKT